MSEIATGGTIAAIATAVVPQQGSVGIVRVSEQKLTLKSLHASALGNSPDTLVTLWSLRRSNWWMKRFDYYEAPRSPTKMWWSSIATGELWQQVLQLCLEQG